MKTNDLIGRIWISLLLFCYIMCSCRTEYVPFEVVRYDSLLMEKMIRDSIYVRDSGDTVFMNKEKFVYIYKELVDTVYLTRYRKTEVPVPVEKKLSWWDQMKVDYAELIFGILVGVALLIKLRQWLARRLRKE